MNAWRSWQQQVREAEELRRAKAARHLAIFTVVVWGVCFLAALLGWWLV